MIHISTFRDKPQLRMLCICFTRAGMQIVNTFRKLRRAYFELRVCFSWKGD
jgi:hypothetical protein